MEATDVAIDEAQVLEKLERLLESEDAAVEPLTELLGSLDARETARAVCELPIEQQAELLRRLSPEAAVEVLDTLPEVTVVEAVEELPADVAAAIVHELPSDDQADLIGAMDSAAAAAVLAELADDEAERIAELAAYPEDCAGGLMATEVVALRDIATVETTLRRLRAGATKLRDLDVQYAYVVAKGRRLVGVLRLRDLLIADERSRLTEIMIADPLSIPAETPLDELIAFFDSNSFLGVPVVDGEGRLLGVVSRRAVDEAAEEQATSDYRRSMGVVAEELRSMPVLRRSRMRLSWLSVNILLNVVAASVIAAYEETLSSVIALAVFLPIISDMSGCSGNQAVAVSMRELSLGLLRPSEWLRVWIKEGSVGFLNGLVLGGLLGVVAALYAGNVWMGIVVGGALAINTLVAVLLGGVIPLALKRAGVDPALASSPLLTTVTDMCGFFSALSLATLLLDKLV
ncbi:magnesium transporter [Botrimarina mediterranea]|uniref:Magnesium transporter MgtE n=1 Tax=Botrimarina mediterranea TaxID=2528022 RepID=A0A518KAT9_9BACT|nr:magnesium transporter [Botrimarina mediterranea]QDV74904.1 Magnesium transporter MgtE [Botrimarina mediterranea]QDV79547.1 Magnesium transporter MgtE [Planctomycetes bacterium K2D]